MDNVEAEHLKLLCNTLKLRAPDVARMFNMNEKSIRRMMNGKTQIPPGIIHGLRWALIPGGWDLFRTGLLCSVKDKKLRRRKDGSILYDAVFFAEHKKLAGYKPA